MSDDKQFHDTMGSSAVEAQPVSGNPVTVDEATGDVDLPAGWKHKKMHVGSKTTWYASPKFQLIMVSFVCFMCPGMFNALGGLGGGGKASPVLADNMVSLLPPAALSVFLCFATLRAPRSRVCRS